MSWTIEHSKDAVKFLNKNPQYREGIRAEIIRFIKKINGEVVSIDVKKLSGNWDGFYRIRKGQIRIIFSINLANQILYIDKIDFRGSVY